MADVSADPDELETGAQQIRDSKDEVDSLLEYMEEANPDWWMWGMPGLVFAPIYFAGVDMIRNQLEEGKEAIAGVASLVEKSASRYRETDEQIAKDIGEKGDTDDVKNPSGNGGGGNGGGSSSGGGGTGGGGGGGDTGDEDGGDSSEPDGSLPSGTSDLDDEQLENVASIIEAGREKGMSDEAIVVALSTAMQESTFYNRYSDNVPGSEQYTDSEHGGSDHDSVGLFQQREEWWGPVEEMMDPEQSAGKFYDALDNVDGWEDMSVTEAAQAVQNSAYPDAYAKHEGMARDLLSSYDENN